MDADTSAPTSSEQLDEPHPIDVFATRRLAFEGHLGFGTPVGDAGMIVEYSVVPFLGLGAGAGVGSGPTNGNHFHGAVVARALPLRGRTNALVLGGAYSFGGYQRLELFIPNDQPSDYFPRRGGWTHWAQADVGWEHRWEDGLLLRLSMGGAWLLNPSDLECYAPPSNRCGSSNSESLFTLDIAVGYAL